MTATMNDLIEVSFGKMLPGTLVLNARTSKVEQVQTIQFEGRKPERTSLGPRCAGHINGMAITDFNALPVTIPLLASLGWKIEHDAKRDATSAWPPSDQFEEPESAEAFEVRFILGANDIDGWKRGSVITTNGAGDWVEVSDFTELELFFLGHYDQRMEINFDSGISI